MRFPAKKNAGCPKAPRDFKRRKDGILYPRRVVLGLPSPSRRVCADGRMDGRTYVTITSQPKFLGSIGYQICLAKELRWQALTAGSADIFILIFIFYSHLKMTSERSKRRGLLSLIFITKQKNCPLFWFAKQTFFRGYRRKMSKYVTGVLT